MLCLSLRKNEKVLVYLRTEHGEKLLGSIVSETNHRLKFDFGQEVRVLREKADAKRKACNA